MVCKEDVVLWFKESESYKRIDTMCTLLNMCLPFELRFLGTCLEELGTRDSKELRGIELRVNNSTELATEMAACQHGEPSDIKVRRKMVLYLALIRACNRPCVNELFSTLYSWSNHEFLKTADGDALQELLLVYTMAANHPVFSFEQRMKCGEIYNQIRYGHADYSYTDVPESTIDTPADLPTLSHPLTSATHLISPVPAEMSAVAPMQNIVLMPAQMGGKHEQLIGVATPVMGHVVHADNVQQHQQPPPMHYPRATDISVMATDKMENSVVASADSRNFTYYRSAPYSTHQPPPQPQRQNMMHTHQRYPAHLSDVSAFNHLTDLLSESFILYHFV